MAGGRNEGIYWIQALLEQFQLQDYLTDIK